MAAWICWKYSLLKVDSWVLSCNIFPSEVKNDTDVMFSFCELQPETVSLLLWSCRFTHKLWKDMKTFIVQNFSLFFKDVIFSFYLHDKDNDSYLTYEFRFCYCKILHPQSKFNKTKHLFRAARISRLIKQNGELFWLLFSYFMKKWQNTGSSLSDVNIFSIFFHCYNSKLVNFEDHLISEKAAQQ